MAMQNYSVSLDNEVVEECKTYYVNSGGKLSPLLNKLLVDWLARQKKGKIKPVTQDKKKKDDELDLLSTEELIA